MKASAGRVLMLVENRFPTDARVRNEAFTLATNGFHVSVIALRGASEPQREVVNGVSVYRVPRITLFKKLPDIESSRARALLRKLQIVMLAHDRRFGQHPRCFLERRCRDERVRRQRSLGDAEQHVQE